MKVSDYIADFLSKRGIRHVFAISGGASIHLIDSIARNEHIVYICPQHEQAGAMAADAYSRITGNFGVAMSTSGPGATNMITGVCCAYYDSIPVVFITGQVSTFRLKGNLKVRQIGFQETDVVEMYRPITKYAIRINSAKNIRFELEKAFYLSKSERPGPVVIDIPDNIQREQINPKRLKSYIPKKVIRKKNSLNRQIDSAIELIKQARRPVIIPGWGIKLSKSEKEAIILIEKLGFPVVPTWAALDLLPYKHDLFVGTFGSHGTRYGNFTVQNSDLVLSIGARLDSRASSPISALAREARKIIVDIDPGELSKFRKLGLYADVLIQADASDFIKALSLRVGKIPRHNFFEWRRKIEKWKKSYPICSPEYFKEETPNPYVFMKILSKESLKGDVIFVDTGCALAWMMQAFECKEDQRLFHDFNNTAMGYALPASIGASLALGKKPVVCVTGDGSLQMNIQELITVLKHKLPIKIFLLNNHGYSMIQQTQDQWLDSKYSASDLKGGLAFPNFNKVATAYGYHTVNISRNTEIKQKIKEVFGYDGPVFCNVEINQKHRVIPQVKYGRSIEDSEPLLNRKEFLKNMLVKPYKSSLE